jgi:hypothetical protein
MRRKPSASHWVQKTLFEGRAREARVRARLDLDLGLELEAVRHLGHDQAVVR